MEDGSETMSREETAQLLHDRRNLLVILKVLCEVLRIKHMEFAGKQVNLIQKERLMLVPHATLSIEAKQQQDRR